MLRKNNSYVGLVLLLLALAGCKQVPVIGSYKIDIQQGNVVTQEMLDKLQPGMTRSQVRFVLGTPLLVDPFRNDRWDYIYTLNKKGDLVQQRQLKVYFKDDKMVRYEGEGTTEGKPAASAAVTPKPAAKPAAASAPAPVQPQPKPEIAQPAPATPAKETTGAVETKPQLRLSPSEGQPATPEEKAVATPAVPVAVQPAPEPVKLEEPPLPRLKLPPEGTEPAGATPDSPAKP